MLVTISLPLPPLVLNYRNGGDSIQHLPPFPASMVSLFAWGTNVEYLNHFHRMSHYQKQLTSSIPLIQTRLDGLWWPVNETVQASFGVIGCKCVIHWGMLHHWMVGWVWSVSHKIVIAGSYLITHDHGWLGNKGLRHRILPSKSFMFIYNMLLLLLLCWFWLWPLSSPSPWL